MIIIDEKQFLVGNSVGAFTLIKGFADTFAGLPVAADHSGEFWFVKTGSSPYVPLTSWFKYPAGLYTPISGVWEQAPISVDYTETTGLVSNITDWATFYPLVGTIAIGSRITFNGVLYTNKTGSVSSTTPALDATNWESKIIVEKIASSTNKDLTLSTSLNYTAVLENPVYEDLNFDPSASGGPAVSIPDYVTINDVIYREFTSGNNQKCGSGAELPHNYKLSGTLQPHLHIFLKTGENAGTTGVSFTFYWALRESDGTLTYGNLVLSATSAQLTSNPVKFNLYGTAFAGADTLGAQLSVAIARTAGDAGDVIVTTFGVHYPIDTMGSRQLGVK